MGKEQTKRQVKIAYPSRPTPEREQEEGLENCQDILKRTSSFLLMLSAIDREGDHCIDQDSLGEVFNALYCWNEEVLREVDKLLADESQVA